MDRRKVAKVIRHENGRIVGVEAMEPKESVGAQEAFDFGASYVAQIQRIHAVSLEMAKHRPETETGASLRAQANENGVHMACITIQGQAGQRRDRCGAVAATIQIV